MKHQLFTYFLYKIADWYRQDGLKDQNDVSVLKALKLLFLTVSAETLNHDDPEADRANLLFNYFNDFRAFPLGHVELDIYKSLTHSKGETDYYKINNESLIFKTVIGELGENPLYAKIDQAINQLRDKNPKIINYTAYQLVELTHKWDSWKFFYTDGKSERIPVEVMITEPKVFR